MSLAGDSGNCMTVIDQVSWRQSMQAFVYRHGELVLNLLANWQPMKVAEHRSDLADMPPSSRPRGSGGAILNYFRQPKVAELSKTTPFRLLWQTANTN